MKIRELSRISGISAATISRMLKNPNSVKESTKRKINEALASNNINNVKQIILIIPDLNNTFYIDLFNGIISVAQNKNIPFQVYLTGESIKEEIKIFSRIKNDNSIGVIWIPASEKRDKLPYEDNNNIISLVDRDLEFDSIYIKNLSDNFSAAKQATDLLIEGGSKNPIIITGNLYLSNARERKNGFLESVKNYSLDNTERVYYGDFNDSRSGYKIIKNLIENKIPFDGILAANQIVAIGILRALKDFNLKIPKDVSIISFDKLSDMYIEDSKITEVVFPAFDIGTNAAKILLEQKSLYVSKHIYNYSAQFYLRGSERK